MEIRVIEIYRRTRRLSILLTAALSFFISLIGCRGKEDPDHVFTVGVVMDVGGKDDKGKNALIWRGCQKASEEFPIEIDCREPVSLSEAEEALDELIGAGADLIIIGATPLNGPAAKRAAANPDVDFLLLDGSAGGDNVLALSFPYEDVGYVVGAAAAALYPDGRFGFVGGRNDEPTRELSEGFSRAVYNYTGAKPEIAFLGKGFDAPADTDKAIATAVSMYVAGVDVIFAAAGVSNQDIFAVAMAHGRYAIGSEANQNWVEPGNIFLSASRRIDEVVWRIILDDFGGRFDGGVRRYTIADDVVEFPFDEDNEVLYEKGVIGRIENVRSELSTSAAPGAPAP